MEKIAQVVIEEENLTGNEDLNGIIEAVDNYVNRHLLGPEYQDGRLDSAVSDALANHRR